MGSISISTKLAESPAMRVTAESDLMKNYLGALPASPERDLFAVHDSRGRPIVFGFSPDGRFYAIHHRDDGATGWAQVDLTPGLPDAGVPVTAAAAQLPGGNIFVAVGLRDKNDPSKSHVAIAGPLSPDLAQTDWAKLGPAWSSAPARAAGSQIEKILIGPVDDGRGFGIPTVAVSVNGAAASAVSNFLLRAEVATDTGAVGWSWVDFPTPTVKAELRDFALGSIADLGAGVYLLYEGDGPSGDEPKGQTTWLLFKTLVDKNGKSFDRQLIAPPGARCLAASPGRGGTTGLFVAGAGGVHWFAPENQGKRTTAAQIAGADALPEIMPGGLVVRGDQLRPGTTSVWALSGEDLYSFNDADGQNGGWSPPLLFRRGVARFAPLANDVRYANELLVVGTDAAETRSLSYLWQDPATTLWKADSIPLESTSHLYEFNCYTTHLSFEDGPSGQPLAGRVLRVSASSRARVVINGVAHVVDEGTSVEALTDFQGNVTLINRVRDLSTPLVHLRADFFDGVLDVDPAHNVADRLRKVQGPGDVPMPKQLPDKLKPSDVVAAVQALAKLHPQSASPAADSITYRAEGAPKARLNTGHLPTGGGFAMSFTGGGARVHDGPSALASAASFTGWLAHAVGDAIEFLTSVAHKVERFVVTTEQDVVKFVAYLGETAVQFVVKTAEEVYKLVTWVFHKIKVAFEELIHWLGNLFEWKDIWQTHKKIAAMAKNGLDYVADRADAEVEHWERRVDEFFEHLAVASKGLKVRPDMGSLGLKPSGAGANTAAAKALRSPIGNWSYYQLQHGGLAGGPPPAAMAATLAAAGPDEPHTSLLEQIGDGFRSGLHELRDAIRAFMTAWQSGHVTLADVGKLAEAPLLAALEPLRPLVKGAFELIRSALRKIRSALDEDLPIPFVGTLYKWLTALFGDEERLTSINALALLVAIPATLISRLSGHGAPFSGERSGLDRPQVFDRLFGARATPAVAAVALAARAEGDDEDEPSNAAKGYLLIGGLIASCVGAFPPIIRCINAALTASEAPGSANDDDSTSGTELTTLPPGDGNAQQAVKWSGRIASWVAKGWRDTANSVLLVLNLLCDVVQLATTVPLPQKDLPKNSAGYILRVVAAGARYLVILPISYLLQFTGYFKNRISLDITSAAFTIVGDLVGTAFALTSAGLSEAEPKQWLADSFSNVGGLVQGVGEALAVATKNVEAPITKGVLAVATAASCLGGLALAETGIAFYIVLAVDSGTSDNVSFTNPGG